MVHQLEQILTEVFTVLPFTQIPVVVVLFCCFAGVVGLRKSNQMVLHDVVLQLNRILQNVATVVPFTGLGHVLEVPREVDEIVAATVGAGFGALFLVGSSVVAVVAVVVVELNVVMVMVL
ncbi:hypothetical protein WICPIJ_003766 [Wickerhamomyces pijperi]|uniref:Uncharacterized protein n=1 Tax=Wickerhamomyces pijperi TaxID=599730 RepID=A0A9P8Q6K6_WICPI|nr:hypothetical protein WICPIJ_003766 [Wickerhamomyces pijperi]